MGPLPPIEQIYLACAGLGSLMIVFMGVMGAAHGHAAHGGHSVGHGPAHGAGHGPAHGPAHGGAHGVSHGAGHGAGHAHGATHGTAGHGHTHTTAGGHGAGDHGAAGSHSATHGGAHGSGQGGAGAETENLPSTLVTGISKPVLTSSAKGEDILIKLFAIFGPMSVATFVCAFGIAGVCLIQLLPFIPATTTVPIAIVVGVVCTKLLLNLIGWMTSKMDQSTTFRKENLIGFKAEVTVGFDGAKTGEITVAAGGPRFTASARANKPGLTFKRGSSVVICDFRDDIAYVEPWAHVDVFADDYDASAQSAVNIQERETQA